MNTTTHLILKASIALTILLVVAQAGQEDNNHHVQGEEQLQVTDNFIDGGLSFPADSMLFGYAEDRAKKCKQKKKCTKKFGGTCQSKGASCSGRSTKGCSKGCSCCLPISADKQCTKEGGFCLETGDNCNGTIKIINHSCTDQCICCIPVTISTTTQDPASGSEGLSWRDDARCGKNYLAPNGLPGQCTPGGYPCCSASGWCGNTPSHCNCGSCINYNITISTTTQDPASGSKELGWRDDHRCGEGFLAPNGLPAQCNPLGGNPCCSDHGWCGDAPDHCTCDGCVDYSDQTRGIMTQNNTTAGSKYAHANDTTGDYQL